RRVLFRSSIHSVTRGSGRRGGGANRRGVRETEPVGTRARWSPGKGFGGRVVRSVGRGRERRRIRPARAPFHVRRRVATCWAVVQPAMKVLSSTSRSRGRGATVFGRPGSGRAAVAGCPAAAP